MRGTRRLDRLQLPAIAAPMTGVSGPELVTAACRNGVVGSFPTHNAPSVSALGEWLEQIDTALTDDKPQAAPIAPNLIVHSSNKRLDQDLQCVISHGVEIVITSVGSPADVVSSLHAAGSMVLADVATMRHVDRALEAGVDGLVLLTAGAGGQTGSANAFAFVRAVREHFDGTIVLAGGVTDGRSMLAARVLGADLVYLGTRLIATEESMASDEYRAALIDANLDEIQLTSEVGGIPANLLSVWLEDHYIPPDKSQTNGTFHQERLLRNRTVWSAGHSVTSIKEITTVATVLATIRQQYDAAREHPLLDTKHAP